MSQSIYKKTFPRSEPIPIPWAARLIDLVVQTWTGLFVSQESSFCTPKRPTLDPRYYEWVEAYAYISRLLNPNQGPTVAQYAPAIFTQGLSYQTPLGKSNWIPFFQAPHTRFGIPFDPALIQGALYQLSNSYTTPKGRFLAVPIHVWDQEDAYLLQQSSPFLQTIGPVIVSQGLSFRSVARTQLDVTKYGWNSVDWTYFSASQSTPQIVVGPSSQSFGSFMSLGSAKVSQTVNSWNEQDGWIQYVTTLPPTPQPLHPPADVTWYRNFS